MRHWALLILAYPVIFVLAVIFISPTIPIDISIVIIASLVAALGLSRESQAIFRIRPALAAWRVKILFVLKGRDS